MKTKHYPPLAITYEVQGWGLVTFTVTYMKYDTCPYCRTKSVWQWKSKNHNNFYCDLCGKGIIGPSFGQQLEENLHDKLKAKIKEVEVRRCSVEDHFSNPISQLEL